MQKDANSDKQDVSDAPSPGKKPYQKPEFRYERVFETMALSCGKVVITEFQCRLNRRAS